MHAHACFVRLAKHVIFGPIFNTLIESCMPAAREKRRCTLVNWMSMFCNFTRRGGYLDDENGCGLSGMVEVKCPSLVGARCRGLPAEGVILQPKELSAMSSSSKKIANASASAPACELVVAPPEHKRIARLAYSYWEARGWPLDSPDEDWFRAEEELRRRKSAFADAKERRRRAPQSRKPVQRQINRDQTKLRKASA